MSAPVATRDVTPPPVRPRRPAPQGGAPEARPKRRIDVVAVLSLFIFLTTLIPSRLIFGALGGAGTPATLLGLVALIWWIYARVVPGAGLAKGYQPLRIVVAVFVVVCTLTYVVAFSTRTLARDELTAADRNMIALAAFAGIILLASDGIDRMDRLDVLLRRLVFFATILSIFGFIQFFTGFDLGAFIKIPGMTSNFGIATEVRSTFRRVAVTAAHPIEFGVFLAMTWPIAVHFALQARSKLEMRRAWASAVLISGALAMSLSRSAILGAGAAGCVMAIPWTWRRRANALAVLAGFVVAMRLFIPGLVGTLRGLFQHLSSDSSYQARVLRYPTAYHLIHQRPLFGRGIGTMLPDSPYGIIPLDNELLKWTIETGVIGLVALLAVFVVGMATARGAYRRSTLPETRELAMALLGSILACTLASYTFDAWSYPMVTGTLALLLGCIGALWRLTRRGPTAQTWGWLRRHERTSGAGSTGDRSPRLGE